MKGRGHENIGIAADIPQNKPLRMHLLSGKGHDNRGIAAADIPKSKPARSCKGAVIERERA